MMNKAQYLPPPPPVPWTIWSLIWAHFLGKVGVGSNHVTPTPNDTPYFHISLHNFSCSITPHPLTVAAIGGSDEVNKAAEDAVRALDSSFRPPLPSTSAYRGQHNESQKSNVSPLPQYSPGNYNLNHQPRYNTLYYRSLLALHQHTLLMHFIMHPINSP